MVIKKPTKSENELFEVLGKYIKDSKRLVNDKIVSFEELKSATIGVYEDVSRGYLDFETFSWVITALVGYGVWGSKGFGEIYKDRNLIKALEVIADPIPYTSKPTREKEQRRIRRGLKYLEAMNTKR